MTCSGISKGETVINTIWAMKCTRDIKTQAVVKWKDRLNFHGGKQEYAVNYFETYLLMAKWAYIMMILILSILKDWQTCQVGFVIA